MEWKKVMRFLKRCLQLRKRSRCFEGLEEKHHLKRFSPKDRGKKSEDAQEYVGLYVTKWMACHDSRNTKLSV